MALNLEMTKEHWDASERAKQATLRQRKMSQEELILQARSMLDQETSGLQESCVTLQGNAGSVCPLPGSGYCFSDAIDTNKSGHKRLWR
jgi:hypothetical protein